MNADSFLDAVLAMPQADKWTFGSLLLVMLASMGLLLFLERRHFKHRNMASSWLALRLLALVLLLPLTIGVVLVPARSISGMEALAFFYGALFTLGPLVWFGGHRLLGRLLRPSFSKGQSLYMAVSGLVILSIPAAGLTVAEGPARLALHNGEARRDQIVSANPLTHVAQPPRRFTLPGVGTVFTQTLSAAGGIHLERAEEKSGETWDRSRNNPLPTFCRHEDDLHLMWSAREPTPKLRIYWRQPDGKRLQGIFSPDAAALAGAKGHDFAIVFRNDGFDPPAPIPRQRAQAGRRGALGELYFSHLNQLQPGENPGNDCLMRGYKRFDWQQEGRIQALSILFPAPSGQLRAEIQAPTEPLRP